MVLGVGVGPGGEVVAVAPVATAISVAATSKKDRRPMVWEGVGWRWRRWKETVVRVEGGGSRGGRWKNGLARVAEGGE